MCADQQANTIICMVNGIRATLRDGIYSADPRRLRESLDAQIEVQKRTTKSRGRPESEKTTSNESMKTLGIISPLLWLQVYGNETAHRALIDSGSSVNLINESVLERFPHRRMMDFSVNLHGVGGLTETFSKWYLVWINFPNGKVLPVPCLVGAPPGMDLLFGMPFITQINGILDSGAQILYTDVGDYSWSDLTTISTITLPVGCCPEDGKITAEQIEELDKLIKSAELSEEGKERIRQVLMKHYEVWTRNSIGEAKGIYHEMVLTNSKPICLPPRHIPQKYHEALDGEIEKMMRDGVISPSASPWCTYPVLAPKKDGGIRVAIDYRRLNSVTVPDKSPLPRIEDLIMAVEGSKYFSLLDLRMGFWHVPLRESMKQVTAFRTHRGLYHFNVMPFGLVNAPATFQRWTSDMFRDKRYSGILVYIDDILIHAPTEEEFVDLFVEVIERMSTYGAHLKLSKCEINPPEFNYLGHTICKGVRKPQKKKVEALNRIKDATNVSEVRSILGMFGYYRLYIPNYADIALPLTRLTRKDVKFGWTDEQRNAVKKLANELGSSILRISPTGHEFRLETDASDYALGAVLYDRHEYANSSNPVPIQFLSKTLSETEQRWSTAEKEAYAIIWALETCDPFLRGRVVDVVTDHKNLEFMMSKKTGKISRWVSRFSEYNVRVIYRAGQKNVVADFLSRMIEDEHLWKDTMSYPIITRSKRKTADYPEPIVLDEYDEDLEILDDEDSFVIPGVPLPAHQDFERIVIPADLPFVEDQDDQEEDDWRGWLFPNNLHEPTLEEVLEAQKKEKPEKLPKGCRMSDGKIYYIEGFWVPPSLRTPLIEAIHFLPPQWHPSAYKMNLIIRRLYNWETKMKDLKAFTKSCVTCMRTKPGMMIKDFQPKIHPVDGPFETIYIDFWGEVSWQKKKYKLMTMVDHHTKWAEAAVVHVGDSDEVSQILLTNWISRFGAPRRIVSDNDTPFVSEGVRKLISMLNIKGLVITIYHPEGNSPVETFHRTLKKTLKQLQSSVENKLEFQEALSWTMMTYRALPHEATYDTPSFLTHGTDIKLRLKSTDTRNNFRYSTPEESRLSILNQMRQELQRRYQIKVDIMKKAEFERKQDKERIRMYHGDLVLLKLTDNHKEKLGKICGGQKLISDWSLPMRVVITNAEGTSATLNCPTTGFTTRAYIDRIRFLDKPTTPAMKEHWRTVCNNEKDVFSNLGSRFFDPITDTVSRHHHRMTKKARRGENSVFTDFLGSHSDGSGLGEDEGKYVFDEEVDDDNWTICLNCYTCGARQVLFSSCLQQGDTDNEGLKKKGECLECSGWFNNDKRCCSVRSGCFPTSWGEEVDTA